MRNIKKFLTAWKKTAVRIANFQTRLILSVVYFILILPYFLCQNLTRFLRREKKIPISSSWIDIADKKHTLDELRKQF